MDPNNEYICRLCFSTGNEYINVFNNSESGLDIADVIGQHFQFEVNESDIFPNTVCTECWIKTKSFHNLYQTVTSARAKYLEKFFDDVKEEYPPIESLDVFEQCSVSIEIEPMINSEEGNPYVKHSQLANNDFTNRDGLNIKDEFTDNNLDQYQSADTMHELNFADKMEILRPLRVQDVSSVQKQQIMDQFFDMNCDHCDARFDSLANAQAHYKKDHDIAKGYIKCCQRKLSVGEYVNSHILWHLNPEIFKCEICDAIFKNKKCLYAHRFLHRANELKKHICDICGKEFALKDKLSRHILSRHQFTCGVCNKSFSSENKLKVHERVEHNDDTHADLENEIQVSISYMEKGQIIAEHFDMSCDKCEENMESLEDAQNHYLEKHDSGDGYVKCCSIKLKSETELDEHIAWHLNPQIFKCKVCAKPMKSKTTLNAHLKRHFEGEKRKYSCDECNKQFWQKSHLEDHINRSHGEQSFKCKFCSKSFQSEENVSTHVKIIHIPEMEAERKLMEQNQIIAEHFDKTCDMCTATLDSLDEAKFHYKTEHSIEDGYLKCCGLKFKEINLVRDHIQWHINPDIFKCIICGQDMKRRKALYAHHAHHKNLAVRKYKCDICKKGFGTRLVVERHILNSHVAKLAKEVLCNTCSKSFRSQKHLAAHIQMAHNGHNTVDETNFGFLSSKSASPLERDRIIAEHFDTSCDVCQIQLESLKFAKTHYLTEHKVRRGYIKCCNLKLKHQRIVDDHISWHLNPEAFKCRVCCSLYKNRDRLKMHIACHEAIENGKFVCRLCSKPFGKKMDLNNHMKVHPNYENEFEFETHTIRDDSTAYTGKMHSTENDSKDVELTIPEYFNMTCDLCFVDLESFSHAMEHYLDEHSIVGYIKCCNLKFNQRWKIREHIALHSNPETYKCEVCHKCLKSNIALRTHMLTHGSKYKCDICGKAFECNSHLKVHRSVHEKKDRKFECEHCKKRFPSEVYLKSHVDRMHTPSNHRICDICAKVCKSQALLQCHLRTHSDEPSKPVESVQCGICGSWLKTTRSLKQHMLRHTSGPQKCDQCDKVSPNQHALVLHVRTVHSDFNHKCNFCDKTFKRVASLKDHVATHTGEKLYKCSYCPESFIWRPNCYSHQKKAHPREWSEDQVRKVTAKQAK